MSDFDNIDIRAIRDWQEQEPFKLLVHILDQRRVEIEQQRLSRTHVTKEYGQLKLNYFLGYEDAIKDVLDALKFETTDEETYND